MAHRMTRPQKAVEPISIAQGNPASRTRAVGESDHLVPQYEQFGLLLEGQQEALGLLVQGASLDEVLPGLAHAIERAFAPALCMISIAHSAQDRIVQHAGPGLPFDIVEDTGGGTPMRSALSTGEYTAVEDFALDSRWPHHAAKALTNRLRACRVEPIPECADGIAAAVALYYPLPRPPFASDRTLLRNLARLVGSVVSAASREQALRSASDRFAALAALPGVVVYQRLVTPDDQIRYTYISEGVRDLFGVSATEILSNPNALFSCHGPDYSVKFRERLLSASRSLTTWDVEATIHCRDGRKKYTHAVARPQRQIDGSVLWTGVILDETRTREATVESLSQGFVLYDADDRLIIRNSHFIDLYPSLQDVAVPGAKYEDVVCAELATGSDGPIESVRQATVYRWRIKRHQDAHNMFEHSIGDDRWVLINEHRTSDGGTVVLYTDISELKRRENQVRHMAYHDALTGIPNRTLFRQRIEQALAHAGERGATVAVMCVDLDHFKNVNDSLGHLAGDALLKCVAGRLVGSLREFDTVARLGGDEFGVVLAELPESDYVETLARRLISEMGQPVDFNGQQIVTGISIGIAISSTDGDEADLLLKNADLALYRAKADGRSTFRFFEPEMDARAQARRALEIELRQAVVRQQLELHYQPQIDIESNRVLGFEALVRWRHPEKGLIAPMDFIPLAEDTGIIVSIGEWVLRRACSDAVKWPDSIRVAVNISPAQFKNRDLAKTVADIIHETGLPASRLEVEITESLLLRDVEENLRTLQELKRLGIRIAMDDFGTGYSSLGNLRSFDFDKIKIDSSFVRDIEQNPDAGAIICAVLGLGHSLGMEICAEGVETGHQLAYLRKEGCNTVQGYYYCQPVPASELSHMLSGRQVSTEPREREPWPRRKRLI